MPPGRQLHHGVFVWFEHRDLVPVNVDQESAEATAEIVRATHKEAAHSGTVPPAATGGELSAGLECPACGADARRSLWANRTARPDSHVSRDRWGVKGVVGRVPAAGPVHVFNDNRRDTSGQQCRALSRARRGSRRFREWARVLGGLWSARSAMACSAPASSWSALVRSRSAPANPPGPRPDDQAKLAADSPMSRPPLLDRQRRGWPGRGGHPASHRVAGNLRVRR